MGKTRFIIAGSLIDGSGSEIQRNVYLSIQNTFITAIGPLAELPCKDTSQILDYSHCTILPALVDCSVSLTQSPSVDERIRSLLQTADRKTKEALLKKHIQYCDAYGVLGIVENDDIAPYLECSHTQINGQPPIDIRMPRNPGNSIFDSAATSNTNGDFLKIYYSSNIEENEKSSPGLTREGLCRILQNRQSQKAVVVANGPKQVREALEAGCDAIEQGYNMGLDNLKKMADKKLLWIPGLLRAKNGLDGCGDGGDVCCRFSQRYVAPGKSLPGTEAFWKKTMADHMKLLQEARRHGVTTAIGTGAGSVGLLHGESMAEEMKLFIKAGYSLEETIQSGSENGARFFGMENLGELTVGRKATFLLSRGTVKQLPRKLSFLEGIFVEGEPSTTYRKEPIISPSK